MKIKMKKIISLVLVLLILLSNSPISLAMGKDFYDEQTQKTESIITKKAESIITTKEERKKGFLDKKGNSESKGNVLEEENSYEPIKESKTVLDEESNKRKGTDLFPIIKEANDENSKIQLPGKNYELNLQRDTNSSIDFSDKITSIRISKQVGGSWIPSEEFQDGDNVRVNINYSLKPNCIRPENTKIHYQLPRGIKVSEEEMGQVYSKGQAVGTYKIGTDGKIEITFDDDFIESGAGIDGTVNFKGTASKDGVDEEGKIKFPGTNYRLSIIDKAIAKLREFTLEYSDYEKELLSKFEKIIRDKSSERYLKYEDILELKNMFAFKDDYEEDYEEYKAPEYIDIRNIEIKDGNFFISFYKNSESFIKNIKLELAKELSLEEGIYSDKDIQEIRFILKELKDLEKSVEKLNESKQLRNKLNYLDDEVNQLYDREQSLVLIQPLDNIKNPNSLDYEAKKEELIKALHAIKPSYNLEAQGLERLEKYSIFEDKLENISLIPKNSKAFDDFTLAFKPTTKDIKSDHLLKITVDGDLGKQVLLFEKTEFAEVEELSDLIPRSNNIPDPDTKVPNLQKQKTIDYLGDKVKNPDTNIQNTKTLEEIVDNYRIYLDVSSQTQAEKNGIDLVVVVDRSGSMKKEDMRYGYYYYPRYLAVHYFLNGPNGFIKNFLNQNPKNNISVVDFGGITKALSRETGFKTDGTDDAKLLQDWTSNEVSVPIYEPRNEGTNYDAGLKIAEEQFSKKTNSKNSKVMLFLSDGVPTYYIDSWGRRKGDGRIYNTNNPNANQNVVRSQMLYYNVPDFYKRNPDIRTIAVGVSRDINSTDDGSSTSPDILREMAYLSGGVFLGIKENIDELTSQLANEVLYAVSQVTVTDTLSKYVKLDSTPDFKVTVTDTNDQIKTLWENGEQTPENENGKYIKSVESETAEGEEKVILTFNPNYKLDKNLKFTLSYNVTVPKETFEEYQKDGYLHTGDSNTDYLENTTSSGKEGFHSNKEAYVDYVFGPEEKPYKEFYDHPVVQVELQNLTIKKVDSVGNPLQNAKFAIYKENPDDNQNVQPLELYESEVLSGNKKTEFITSDKGEVKIYGLVHGTYYLKEIEAPEGFSKIDNSLKVEISRLGKVSIEQDSNFSLKDNTVKVRNELMGGYELPTTGGPGTILFRLIGLFVLTFALVIPYRKRQIKCER